MDKLWLRTRLVLFMVNQREWRKGSCVSVKLVTGGWGSGGVKEIPFVVRFLPPGDVLKCFRSVCVKKIPHCYSIFLLHRTSMKHIEVINSGVTFRVGEKCETC